MRFCGAAWVRAVAGPPGIFRVRASEGKTDVADDSAIRIAMTVDLNILSSLVPTGF
jgi:hypothetical protein